jgi:hypothetical protein
MEAIRRPSRVVEGSRLIGAILDMDVPFLGAEPFRSVGLRAVYVCQMPATTGLFAWQQLIVCIAPNYESGIPDSKRPPETGGLGILCLWKARLLGRLLPRRIERAGIVDLGDLVVGEAEHLAQDLVGVLAEQRRARHLAR